MKQYWLTVFEVKQTGIFFETFSVIQYYTLDIIYRMKFAFYILINIKWKRIELNIV